MVVHDSTAGDLPDLKHREQILEHARVILSKANELETMVDRFEAAQRSRFQHEYETLRARGFLTALQQVTEESRRNFRDTTPGPRLR